jgi:hypothetical protein
METSSEKQPLGPDSVLILIKDAIGRCRDSSSRLCGFARGLEIGISTLQDPKATAYDSIERLQERMLRLSACRDDYHCGIAVGINLTTDVVSTSDI